MKAIDSYTGAEGASPADGKVQQQSVLVACLCAEWCGACREYRAVFDQVRMLFPHARFVWIDIEDEADLVDPVEVSDFPTVLVASGDVPRFFGTVMPQAATLERLVRDRAAGEASAIADRPDVSELVGRLRDGGHGV